MNILRPFSKLIQVNDVKYYIRKPLSTFLVPDIYVIQVSDIWEENKKFPLCYCGVRKQWYYGYQWWNQKEKEYLGDDMVKICIDFYKNYIATKKEKAEFESEFDKAWDAIPDKIVVKA